VLILLILAVAVVWLAAVFSYHSSSGGGDLVKVGYFNLFNGRITEIGSEGDFFHLQIPRSSNVRLAIVWWFIFVAIFHVILTSTSFGNGIFATGGNEGAARAQGVNVDRVKLQNFVIVAVLTGIAAIYETARNPGVDPLKGTGFELEVIAMAVIGGALLTGGYGSVVGSLLGALIFGMLQTGLVLVGIESRLFTGTIGVIIIAAVVLNTLVRGSQRN
jgi:simple sugar transport system permease protein